MSSESNKKLPMHLWMPCYPAPEMQVEHKPDGLHVTTKENGAAYALRYPLLKTCAAKEYVFKIRYRLITGDLTFGALTANMKPDGLPQVAQWKARAGH